MTPAGRGTRSQSNRVAHVTCLGCGCACDDIEATVAELSALVKEGKLQPLETVVELPSSR